MRCVSVRLVEVPLRLVAPLRTSTGTHHARRALLTEVTLDDGSVGWGENVSPDGDFYTGESASASRAAMREVLAPRLADEFDDPSHLDSAWWQTNDWPMARAAIEQAAWDAWCRGRGVALASALGGSPRSIEVGAVVGIHDDLAAAVAESMARVDEGYRHLKLKIAPGRDIDVVRAVREVVGADISLSVDANGSFGAGDIRLLASLADHGVVGVEQPFAVGDLSSCAKLRATDTVQVGLDESIMSLDDLMAALAAGALDAVNVKPSRLGGLGASIAVLEKCIEDGVGAWIGGMLESGVGRAAALALATHPACTSAPDLSASSRYFESDVTEPFVLRAGTLSVPGLPGIGVDPRAEMLQGCEFETLWPR